jgi:hypothetical protein
MISLTDFKGDNWQLQSVGVEIHKETNIHYVHWLVIKGPQELQHYPVIDTPVFTEWWS